MLKKEDLYKLEEYSEERNKFKEKVLEVKNNRSVLLGKNINLLFENLITIKYQIQEMLIQQNMDSNSIHIIFFL